MSMIQVKFRSLRVALLFLCVVGFVVGVWALIFPQGFYDAFPGFGRVWIPPSGPYNEHLVRDVGALNLALGLLAALGLVRPGRVAPWAVGVVTLAYNLPHLIYHLTTLSMYDPLDQAGNVVALGAAFLASLVLIVVRPVSAMRGSAP